MEKILTLDLGQVFLSPMNPRKEYDEKALAQLAESIKQQGVIEPIVVRSAKDGKYEVVCGSRRVKASEIAGEKGIPAIVRELSDEQAYETMIVENLQRADLGEYEEAFSFKEFLKKGGDEAIVSLSMKTGLSPRYIRARVKVFDLPIGMVKAWEKGKLSYGHLEQLLRAPSKEGAAAVFKAMSEDDFSWSVQDLKEKIDEESIHLSVAVFDTKPCASCASNSSTVRDLFGLEVEKAMCVNHKCFLAKSAEAFKPEVWKASEAGKKLHTNTAVYVDTMSWNDRREFSSWGGPIMDVCKKCDYYASYLHLSGQAADRGCIGDKSCFDKVQKAREAIRDGKKVETTDGKKAKKSTKVADLDIPRVDWHGEFFRNAFYEKRIPEAVALSDDTQIKILALVALARHNGAVKSALGTALGKKEMTWYGENVTADVLAIKPAQVEKALRASVAALIEEGQRRDGGYSNNGFGSTNRHAVAKWLGIDLAKEWAVTEEYLDKKTTREVLSFIRKNGLDKDKKFKTYLAGKLKKDSPEKCKKSELVEIVLKSGVKLVGLVPKEIFPKEK